MKVNLAKKISTATKLKLGFVAGTTLAGAAAMSASNPPGLKKEGAKYGAVLGAATGLGVIFSPKIAKTYSVGLVQQMKRTKVGKAYRTGKVVFRKIRGRIIPIRVKSNG
jgi:hypothetical protein